MKWPTSPSVLVRERPPKPERTPVSSPALANLQSALEAIPSSPEQSLTCDEWRGGLFAIHHATEGSDEGLALAHAFSSRSPKYDPDFIDNRFWPYAGKTSGQVITERTLYAKAQEHGWIDPAIADDFQALPDPPPETGEVGRFKVIPESQFLEGKPPGWIVKGLVPDADIAVVFGESGSGKSFFVFDLVCSVARGVTWRGKRVRQGRVIYIAAEGASHFRTRIQAYKTHHGVDELDLGVIPAAPNLLKAPDVKELIQAIKEFGPALLIVVDTLAQTTAGANENSGEDMGKALEHCKAIRRATGVVVMLVHHAGKDVAKGARGWSGIKAAADAEIEISRNGEAREATISKLKDGVDGERFAFRLNTVAVGEDEDGDQGTSCVVEHLATTGPNRLKGGPKGDNEVAVWTAFEELVGLTGESVGVNQLLAASVLLLPVSALDGGRDRRLERCRRALKSLVSKGVIDATGDSLSLVK